jgi:hypothetical protein
MNQDEFNDLILDRFEALEKENKALKKQIGAINPELLADMKITMDSAQSMHSVIQTERAQMAEQSLQNRKLREEQNAAFEARHRNAMEAMRKQTMHIYDSQAQTQSMLDRVEAGHQQYERNQQSAKEHQEWMEANYTVRREELERFAAKDFIEQLINQREAEGLTRLQQEHLDRNLRMLVSDPTAFAQQINQTFNPEPENNN